MLIIVLTSLYLQQERKSHDSVTTLFGYNLCNQPLYLSTVPFALCLILKTHLEPLSFFPGDKSTISQLLLLSKAPISLIIVVTHLSS